MLNEEKTIRNGGIAVWDEAIAKHYENVILASGRHYNFSFDPKIPICNYTGEQRNFLLYGINDPDFAKKYKDIKAPKKVSEGNFEGIIPYLLNQYKKNPLNPSNDVAKYIVHEPCTECDNAGLGRIGRETTINGKTIIDVASHNLGSLLRWINELDQLVQDDELKVFTAFSTALKQRISNLIEVGLDYFNFGSRTSFLIWGRVTKIEIG